MIKVVLVFFIIFLILFYSLPSILVLSQSTNNVNYFTFIPIGALFEYNITSVGNVSSLVTVHRYIFLNAKWMGEYFIPYVNITINDSLIPKPISFAQIENKEILLINVLSDIGIYQFSLSTMSFGYYMYNNNQVPVVIIQSPNETEYISLEYGVPLHGYGIIGNNRFNFNLVYTNLTFSSTNYRVYNLSYKLNTSYYNSGYMIVASPGLISANMHPVYYNVTLPNGKRVTVAYPALSLTYNGFLALFMPSTELSEQFNTIGVIYFNSSRYYVSTSNIPTEQYVKYINTSNPFIIYPFFVKYYTLFAPNSGNITIVFDAPYVKPVSYSMSVLSTPSTRSSVYYVGAVIIILALVVFYYYAIKRSRVKKY
ncbi:MAG: hypothetical protein OWQ54_05820 [Sulfolobaceae archaeon]|nr:hypothetical protein [Sulfolobaceae archaeon]